MNKNIYILNSLTLFSVQLTKDLSELNSIIGQLSRPRNVDLISLQTKRIETELINLREQQKTQEEANKSETIKPAVVTSETKRYECELTSYAWDQSDKFVKLFVALDGVQNASEDDVIVTFTSNSILLKVLNVQNKDHKFTINNLLHDINVDASYRKIKSNTIAIYAKKITESKYRLFTCNH